MSSTHHTGSLRIGVTGLTNETINCYQQVACARSVRLLTIVAVSTDTRRKNPLMRILHDSQLALEFVDVSNIEAGYFQQNQTWSGEFPNDIRER